MAGPRKCRRVCSMPKSTVFLPENPEPGAAEVNLTIEEYETIRLIDWVGLTQEECSDFMQVARTTVQQIYWDARKKIAQTLVQGAVLRIRGGNYELCEENFDTCGRGYCSRRGKNPDQEVTP